MSGLAVFPSKGGTLDASRGAISNLWSPGGPGLQALGGGGRWAINKGLRGPKKFAEGLRLQLHGEQMEESDADSHWALGPPLSQQSL